MVQNHRGEGCLWVCGPQGVTYILPLFVDQPLSGHQRRKMSHEHFLTRFSTQMFVKIDFDVDT